MTSLEARRKVVRASERERRALASRWLSPAHERLRVALDELRAAGQEPLCASSEREAWTSDDDDLRAVAALFCAGCPVLEACAEAEEGESFGVWAGIDRHQQHARPAA